MAAEVIETTFGRQYAEEYIPTDSDGFSPWVKTIVYERVTDIGLAQWVNNADMPWADVSFVEERREVRTMGSKVGWTLMELEEARQGGRPLDREKLRAQKRSIDASRDTVLLQGDGLLANSGLIQTGFINDPLVTIQAANGTFAARTAAQIIADVIAYAGIYRDNNEQQYEVERILLPSTQYDRMMEPAGTGTDTSIGEYLKRSIPSLQRIDLLPQLAGAGAGGVDRAILYTRRPDIVKGVLPLSFRVLDPQLHDLMTTICAIERQAGTVVKYPPGLLYIDGI